MNKPSAIEPSALILLIDDDPAMLVQLRHCLENEGYRIVEARSGKEAIAAFNRIQPDAVLLDAMLPDTTGFELCSHFRVLPEFAHIPILITTGLEDETSVDRAFAAGASDYVTKPVHWAVLRQRLKRLLHQTQLQRKLEAVNEELQRLVGLDGLTQVANRRHFDEYLHREWQRMQREQLPLSLVLCDIDYFKPYNDTHGHPAGDRCLSQVAMALQDAAKRPGDLVARYGGEEFAIILPNTHTVGAMSVAERVCDAIKSLEIPHTSSVVSQFVTLSSGTASIVPQLGLTPDALLAAADKALYQAKAEGRNRAALYTGGKLSSVF
jgi:diguanylate cyclase (GGDEF)-like protein